MVNASKEKYDAAAALELVRSMRRLVAAKGKKWVAWDLAKDDPTDEEILKAILGPSGNMRAPSWKRGKTLVVGFNADAYDAVFG